MNAYTNTYEATMPVNAGNRYFARVVAYKVNEPACKVYSDTKEIQFTTFVEHLLCVRHYSRCWIFKGA